MEEVWKPVPGFEGYYEVSNYCRYRSLERTITYRNGTKRKRKSVVLKHDKSNKGEFGSWERVTLSKNNEHTRVFVYRTAMEAFGIPNPENLPCVNHKDENPSNNFIFVNPDGTVDPEKSNIEWCTHEYNNAYGTARERQSETQKNTRKDRKPVSQYTLEGKYLTTWKSLHQIERELGFFRNNIKAVCEGKRTQSHGFIWKYA